MYYYLYDSCLGDKKYNNIISRIETRLTDLGINGKINRLSFLKNIYSVISEEIKRGVKTIIIVGDDKTLGEAINLIGDLNVTIGIIPIGPNNKIAKLLGIPQGEEACDILSSRIIKKIDLGVVNNYYFITSLELDGKNANIECDNSYIISSNNGENIITINNLNYYQGENIDPKDGQIDIFIKNTQRKILGKSISTLSHFINKKLVITGPKTLPIFITDEKKIIKTPAKITVAPKKLKIIVGKKRCFN